MKGKIVWLTLSFLVAAALVVTSCGPAAEEEVTEEEEEEEEVVTEEEEEEEVAEEEEEEAVVVAEPIYGGTLNVLGSDPVGWDPALTEFCSLQCLQLVASRLVTKDWWKGPAGTNEWAFDIPTVWPPDNI